MSLGNAGQGEVTVSRLSMTEEDLSGLDLSGPLSLRAWTLQELMLSQRHIFYSAEQI